jgi:hypothetical protein
MPDARLIILRSANGEDDWTPVKPEDVPDWLKDPVVMGRLVAGNMAQGPVNVVLPDELRPWFRAVRAETTH